MSSDQRERRRHRARALRVTGRSQVAVAAELGVSETTVRRWLRGDECYWIAECRLCGDAFSATRSNQLFCCKAHSAKHRRIFGAPSNLARVQARANELGTQLVDAYAQLAARMEAELAHLRGRAR